MSAKFAKTVSFVFLVTLPFSHQVVEGQQCVDVKENYEIGKRIPVAPWMVLYQIGRQMCYRECEAYTFCLSINFDRKMLTCELNNQKSNENLRLVDGDDFIYREIPAAVSVSKR
jgi:hypothetical protein